jgi:hypothetical protein
MSVFTIAPAYHPSIYDDYDAIVVVAWRLYSDGAGTALNDSAWWAAYDYYGHDAYGVEYADEVLARAIGGRSMASASTAACGRRSCEPSITRMERL